MQPILSKDSANEWNIKQIPFVFIPECSLYYFYLKICNFCHHAPIPLTAKHLRVANSRHHLPPSATAMLGRNFHKHGLNKEFHGLEQKVQDPCSVRNSSSQDKRWKTALRQHRGKDKRLQTPLPQPTSATLNYLFTN